MLANRAEVFVFPDEEELSHGIWQNEYGCKSSITSGLSKIMKIVDKCYLEPGDIRDGEGCW